MMRRRRRRGRPPPFPRAPRTPPGSTNAIPVLDRVVVVDPISRRDHVDSESPVVAVVAEVVVEEADEDSFPVVHKSDRVVGAAASRGRLSCPTLLNTGRGGEESGVGA